MLCARTFRAQRKSLRAPKKFYIRPNNSKIDSIETGRIVIAHLLP